MFFFFIFDPKINSTNGFQKQKINLAFFDHGMCYTQHSEKSAQHNTRCQNKLVLPLEKQYIVSAYCCVFKTNKKENGQSLKLIWNNFTDLNHWMSSCRGLYGTSAALCLIVGSMVGLGLHFDLQAVWPRAGRQLPVESWQGRANGRKAYRQHSKETA